MEYIKSSLLAAHPQNPRHHNEELMDELATQMREGGFGEEHAILVRPIEDEYQIISGHHRRHAAVAAGIKEIPCHVREMDDEEAYMQLILCNTQNGSLTNVEKAMHVFNCVALGKGGKGKEGGQREYARRVGVSQSVVQKMAKAGSVIAEVNPQGITLDSKIKHLAEIAKLPREFWGEVSSRMIHQDWTVEQTTQAIKRMKERMTEKKIEPVAKSEGGDKSNDERIERIQTNRETAESLMDEVEQDVFDDPQEDNTDKFDAVIGALMALDEDVRYKVYLELKREFD